MIKNLRRDLFMSNEESNKKYFKQAIHLIDNWLNFQTYFKEIPGMAVGIFCEDEIIFKKEYGYADLKDKIKLTDQHLFRIASHSKLFTATAIMKLYHEGKLSIDDKVSKHLPWFTSENDENMQHIRIQHLLTHSSGISRDGKLAQWSIHKFPRIDDIREQIKKGISFFEISETLKYSNYGFTILGQIVEAVSGQPYQEYIQKEILEPLQMNYTVVDVDESNIKKHAIGYGIKYPGKYREKFEHIPANVMHAATGLSSTVNDLITFYQAHFLGNDILFPDYIKREMQHVHFKSEGSERGLGFGIEKINNVEFIGHGGGYPGFITRSGLIQDKKIIIVVLTNSIDGPAAILAFGIIKILEFVIKEKEKLFAKEDDKELDVKDILGFYKSDWGTSLFSKIGSKLVLIAPRADNPTEFLLIYEHKKDQIFTAPKKSPYSSPGEDIEFIDGPDGKKIFLDAHKGENKRFEFSY
ncbi:MAG: beta-lactamase family protein [Asgard group archaeon]|nr:beta-lactamase family protein [Asgard group archaeon]